MGLPILAADGADQVTRDGLGLSDLGASLLVRLAECGVLKLRGAPTPVVPLLASHLL